MGWGGQDSGGGGAALKSPRTWSPVCHANCSNAIECRHREQKVHRTLGYSYANSSSSAVHPPHSHPPSMDVFTYGNAHSEKAEQGVPAL